MSLHLAIRLCLSFLWPAPDRVGKPLCARDVVCPIIKVEPTSEYPRDKFGSCHMDQNVRGACATKDGVQGICEERRRQLWIELCLMDFWQLASENW
jgi:hypothetical protein